MKERRSSPYVFLVVTFLLLYAHTTDAFVVRRSAQTVNLQRPTNNSERMMSEENQNESQSQMNGGMCEPAPSIVLGGQDAHVEPFDLIAQNREADFIAMGDPNAGHLPPAVLSSLADDEERRLRSNLPPAVQMSLADTQLRQSRSDLPPAVISSLEEARQRETEMELPPAVFSSLTDSLGPQSLPPAVLASLAQDVEVEATSSGMANSPNTEGPDNHFDDDDVFNAHFVNRGPSSEAPPIFTQHEISLETNKTNQVPKGEVKLFTGVMQGTDPAAEAIQGEKPEETVHIKQVKTDMGYKMVAVSEEEANETVVEAQEKKKVNHRAVQTSGGFQLIAEDKAESNEPQGDKTPKRAKVIKPVTGGEEWIDDGPPKMKKIPTFSGGFEIVEDTTASPGDDDVANDQQKKKIKNVKTAAGFQMVEVDEDGKFTDPTVQDPSSDPKMAGIGQVQKSTTKVDIEDHPLEEDGSGEFAVNLSGETSIGLPKQPQDGEPSTPASLEKIQNFSGGFEFVEAKNKVKETPADRLVKPKNLRIKQVKTDVGYELVEFYEDEDTDESTEKSDQVQGEKNTASEPVSDNGDDFLSAEELEMIHQASLGENQVRTSEPIKQEKTSSRYKKVQNFSGGFSFVEDDGLAGEEELVGSQVPQADHFATMKGLAEIQLLKEEQSKPDNADSPEPKSSASVDAKYQAHQSFSKINDTTDTDQQESHKESAKSEPKKFVKVETSSGGFEIVEGSEAQELEDDAIPKAEEGLSPSVAGMKLKVDQEGPLPSVDNSIPSFSKQQEVKKKADGPPESPILASTDELGTRASAGFSVPLSAPEELVGGTKAKSSGDKPKTVKKIPTLTGGFEIVEERESEVLEQLPTDAKAPKLQSAPTGSNSGEVEFSGSDDVSTSDAKNPVSSNSGHDSSRTSPAPAHRVRVRQVQTPAGYQMVEYVEGDEAGDISADVVSKFGIRRAEYAETWMKAKPSGTPSNARNEASIGTSVPIRAPILKNEVNATAHPTPSKTEMVPGEDSTRKPRLRQVQTDAGYQMVEYYDDEGSSVSAVSKFGIKRADYAETWMNSKEKSKHVSPESVTGKALEGTSVPIQVPLNSDKAIDSSDVSSSHDDSNTPGEEAVDEVKKPRLRQVQTDAGYQMIEYYEDEDSGVNPISKFGIRRADYAETWMNAKEKSKHVSLESVSGKAIEGTSVPIQAPSKSEKSSALQDQFPRPDQSKRLDKHASRGTDVLIKVPDMSTQSQLPELDPKSDKINGEVALGAKMVDEDSDEHDAERYLPSKAEIETETRTEYRQVQTPAGYKMIESPGDANAPEQGGPAKYGVRRADYVDTWRKSGTNQAVEGSIPPPDQSKRVDEHAIEGTSVPIKAPQPQRRSRDTVIPPPDQAKKVDESAMAGTYVAVKSGKQEGPESKLDMPSPDQTKRLDISSLEGTAVNVQAPIDEVAKGKSRRVKQVRTAAGYQMVPYDEDDNVDPGTKYGIRRADYIDTWREKQPVAADTKVTKEEILGADQLKSIHEQASRGTSVPIKAMQDRIVPPNVVGTLQTDQSREVGKNATEGTRGYIDPAKITAASSNTSGKTRSPKPDQLRRVDERAMEGTAGEVKVSTIDRPRQTITPQPDQNVRVDERAIEGTMGEVQNVPDVGSKAMETRMVLPNDTERLDQRATEGTFGTMTSPTTSEADSGMVVKPLEVVDESEPKNVDDEA